MNKNRISIFFLKVFLLFLCPFSLFAKKPKPPEWDGANYLERELNYVERPELSLLPDFELSRQIRENLVDFDPSGTVEILYRMPKLETHEDNQMLYILNRMSRISTMEGIEYYSGSRKMMYPYLEEAFVAEMRKSETAVDDPHFDTLPREPRKITVYQNDTTFGKAWYDVYLETTGSAIRLSMTNTTTMRYKMFPVMRAERLHIEMIIIPREDDLLFYGLASFKLGNTFGIELKLDESFDHRMSALQVWFNNQVYP